jgi:hypothetical protein
MQLRIPNKRIRGISKTVTVIASDLDIPVVEIGKHISELETMHCRYPIDRVDGHHFFCGDLRRDPKTSYCSHHHTIVWHKRQKP